MERATVQKVRRSQPRAAPRPARPSSPPPSGSSRRPAWRARAPMPSPPPPGSTRRCSITTSRARSELYEAVVEDHFREFNRQALAVLDRARAGARRSCCATSACISTSSARGTATPRCYQQLMTARRAAARAAGAQVLRAAQPAPSASCWNAGMRAGEFRRADRLHTAISIVALIVFYFSAAPVLQMLGHADAYSAAELETPQTGGARFHPPRSVSSIRDAPRHETQTPLLIAARRRRWRRVCTMPASAARASSSSPASSRPTTSSSAPEIQGRLQQLLVKEGDTVKRGQLLARDSAAGMAGRRGVLCEQRTAVRRRRCTQAEADLQVPGGADRATRSARPRPTSPRPRPRSTQAQADLENAQPEFRARGSAVPPAASNPPQASTRRARPTTAPRRTSTSLRKQVQAAAGRRGPRQGRTRTRWQRAPRGARGRQHQLAAAERADARRPRCGWTTPKSARPSTASWTCARRCRARW